MAHDPQQICSRLREIVTTSLTQNNLESAKYFGNKLVAFSNGDQDDVLLLARCYFASREYHRTVHLIEKFKVLEEPISTQKLQFHLLVGQCYVSHVNVISSSVLNCIIGCYETMGGMSRYP